VLILDKLADAKNELAQFLTHNSFGEAGHKVVVEEFLDGIECSCFTLVDNTGNYKILPLAKDYKRIGEGDTGLNTGGMGAISPVPFVDDQLFERIENEVVKPTVNGVKTENYNYKGIIFIGLMVVKGKPYVIEYNVRMGDPETEVVFPRIESDVVDLFEAIAQGALSSAELLVNPQTAATVIAVSGGYPEAYENNKKIKGLEQVTESVVFHAGTTLKEGEVLTSGGRVLALTSFGKDKDEALAKSYNSLSQVKFDKMNYRKDIGFDL
jgi:phosphoribosylamine--glycine ligase